MNKTIKVKSRNTITAITEFGQLLAMDNQVLLGWILAHKGYNMQVMKMQNLSPKKVR